MKKAKTLIKEQLQFRDLLVAHDVKGFRRFVKKRSNKFPLEVQSYDDEKLSEFMYFLKTKSPYLGEHFQSARNYFRAKALENEIKTRPANEALNAVLAKTDGVPPFCRECQYFRTPPPGEKTACIHLIVEGRAPAIPNDYACIGWTPMSSEKNSSNQL